METDRLRQFCTIVETGSFTKASQLLGISHSGLSKSMKLLEQELNTKLFVPDGRGIAVTDSGTLVYQQAQPILQAVRQLMAKDTFEPEAQTIRIGALEIFTSHLLGALAENHLKDISIEIHEISPGFLETALLDRRIDFGLTFVPVPQPGLDHLEIAKTRLGVFVKRGAFQQTRVEDLPFVVPRSLLSENPLGVKERDGWSDSLFRRKILYRTNLLSTALDLARRGLCAVYIPEFVASLHNSAVAPNFQLENRPLPGSYMKSDRVLYLAKRHATEESALAKKLTAGIRSLCRRN